MRKLGIDFGTKKVGLALSDESGAMAFPHSVIKNDKQLLKTVVALLEVKGATEIVMGHSLDTEGKENAVHEDAKEFMTELTLQTPIPIHLEPEQFTSQQAIKLQGRNDQIDASAAALILQGYIDRQKEGSAFDELDE